MTTLLSLHESPQLDSNIKLKNIINTLPKEVFLKNARKAWLKVIVNLVCVAIGYWLIAILPWFLLPFAWVFVGTGLAGMFVIGHDCGHRSFSNQIWLNDLVGHLMFLPTIYPYHAWRILHNHHHKHTNKLEVDNAWNPFTTETYASFSPILQWWYRRLRSRFWWLGSIAHWANLHFSWWNHTGKDKSQIKFSALLVIISTAIGFPALLLTVGFTGFLKFWLAPWIVYHFWISTFTIVHHTLPDIPFKPETEWNAAEAQLCGTVHCKYPWWVEFLCHDINVHIPHHLTTGIPWYNLRQAHASLQENWGEYLHETEFSWSLMKKIGDRCHLYDAENNYQTFAQHSAK